MVKRILIGLGAILIIIQFFQIDKTNPPVDKNQEFARIAKPSAEVTTLLKDACYDCHSYETQYPWYTSIAPFSWWIKRHIDEGREHLNFSVWGTYEAKRRAHKMEECYEEVEEKHMPLKSYVWMHPEAKLDEEQRALLVDWFKANQNRQKELPGVAPDQITPKKRGEEM